MSKRLVDGPILPSRIAAAWAAMYALYRGYYALGGTYGMFGIPVSGAAWRRINGIGAGILLLAAILPLVLVRRWKSDQRPQVHTGMWALCWVVTVGCVMHALIGMTQRILSLTGAATFDFPFFASIDRRESDLQALFFNEPWFFIEGVLWGAMAWTGGLNQSPHRGWWITSAVVAIVALSAVGILSALGVIGRVIIG